MSFFYNINIIMVFIIIFVGAKEHYVLDINNDNFSKMIVTKIEKITLTPKKKITI